MLHYAAFHQGLYCFIKYLFKGFSLTKGKGKKKNFIIFCFLFLTFKGLKALFFYFIFFYFREPAILLCLKNDGSPLGIHVVPDFTEDGK